MNKLKEIMSFTHPEYLIIGIPLLYFGYKVVYALALEVWCIAYGLIY
jgi:hypothetical protein